MRRLSPLQSKVLALAILIAVVAGVFRLSVAPLWARYEQGHQELESLADKYRRFTRIASTREAVQRRYEQVKQQVQAHSLAFEGENATRMAAELQQRVKEVVGMSGGKLISTQVLPAVEEGAFQRVALSVRMSAEAGALQPILHGLESSVPYLFVDDLVITGRATHLRGRMQSLTIPLDVRMELSGYLRVRQIPGQG